MLKTHERRGEELLQDILQSQLLVMLQEVIITNVKF